MLKNCWKCWKFEKKCTGGASIRYKKGPAIRYKKGPSIRYIGPKFRDFFLKGSRYKVHWSAKSGKKSFLKKFQNFIKNVLFKLISWYKLLQGVTITPRKWVPMTPRKWVPISSTFKGPTRVIGPCKFAWSNGIGLPIASSEFFVIFEYFGQIWRIF